MALGGIPPSILALRPYVPGKPLEVLARELGVSEVLSLASNESAFGASPRVAAALADAAARVHFYPDASGLLLKARLAERHGVTPEQIVLGSGSGEVIELAIRTFAAAGDRVVMSRLGFIQVRLAATAAATRLVEVPSHEVTFRDDLAGFVAAARDAKLVFIANPNNPTGTVWTQTELESYFDSEPAGLTVVDEAYADYVERPDYPSGLDFLRAGHAVLVLRTFSKIFGLAGLRIGYGIASPEVIGYLERVRPVYNTGSLAQAAALAALDDAEHLAYVKQENSRQRARLAAAFTQRGARVTPSETNFLLVHPPSGAGWSESLLRRGVQVRPMDGWGLPGGVRITVGTAEQTSRLLAELDTLSGL